MPFVIHAVVKVHEEDGTTHVNDVIRIWICYKYATKIQDSISKLQICACLKKHNIKYLYSLFSYKGSDLPPS